MTPNAFITFAADTRRAFEQLAHVDDVLLFLWLIAERIEHRFDRDFAELVDLGGES
jgi:hypothetical protein